MVVVSSVRSLLFAISFVAAAAATLRLRQFGSWAATALHLPESIEIHRSFHRRWLRTAASSSTAARRSRSCHELQSSPLSIPPVDVVSRGNADGTSTRRPAPDKDRGAIRLGQFGDLSYRTKKASKSAPFLTNKRNGTSDPFVLIHPVGIGMASWFYDRMLEAWPTAWRSRTDEQNQREAPADPSSSSATLFAINLRGCGRRDARLLQSGVDSAAPISLERWVQDCAAFVDDVVLKDPSLPSPPFPFAFLPQKPSSKRCHLVVQGGLAPLGLELARRYPGRIRSLTLCSPPEVLQVAPQADVEKNLRLLASPLGNAAIERLLENPAAIRLFSNLFLFASPCDAEWVRQASSECGPEVRRAVQFFNAGGCSRVASADLPPLEPPVLILQGSQDLRRRSPDYVASKSRVEFRTLLGAKNVLPWEAPTETAAAIQDFVRQNS